MLFDIRVCLAERESVWLFAFAYSGLGCRVKEEIGVIVRILGLHQPVQLRVLWRLRAEDGVSQSRWVSREVLDTSICQLYPGTEEIRKTHWGSVLLRLTVFDSDSNHVCLDGSIKLVACI